MKLFCLENVSLFRDTLYDKPNNENLQNKLENVQCRACLAATGTIQGTSWANFMMNWVYIHESKEVRAIS